MTTANTRRSINTLATIGMNSVVASCFASLFTITALFSIGILFPQGRWERASGLLDTFSQDGPFGLLLWISSVSVSAGVLVLLAVLATQLTALSFRLSRKWHWIAVSQIAGILLAYTALSISYQVAESDGIRPNAGVFFFGLHIGLSVFLTSGYVGGLLWKRTRSTSS